MNERYGGGALMVFQTDVYIAYLIKWMIYHT
jgi:hypothetical protein